MPRKAKKAPASRKLAKNMLVTMEIMENYLEPHFAALQEDMINLRQELSQELRLEFNQGFQEVKSDIGKLRQEIGEQFGVTVKAILEILKGDRKEIKNVREDTWSLDKRVTKLEKQLA